MQPNVHLFAVERRENDCKRPVIDARFMEKRTTADQ